MIDAHADALAVFTVGAFLLVFIEVRLRALFARHELRETKMHAESAMMADVAAATAREAVRHIEELRAETSAIRLDVNNLSELIRLHETRISEAETKLIRAAVAVPRMRREGDGG
jgi:hypothetical protein